ncbi:Carnitine O-acetyltransferase mitochondrial [Massospora cicadina]|nr:Carnitine O-acetyltransferase mitochondrial [Massospora cicadina]
MVLPLPPPAEVPQAEGAPSEPPAKTFANQSQLPRLPIPALEVTLKRYERSLLPLFSEAQIREARRGISQFLEPEGLGVSLQNRLIEYEVTQKNSWLEEIWLKKAYLEYREPILLNVNWWCEFRDHPKGLVDAPVTGTASQFQLERSAGLISGLLNFNDALNKELITPEYVKEIPLCMNQYRQQIGTTRIPLEKCDRIDSSYPCLAHHIVVSYKNQLAKVPVYGSDGRRASISAIKRQLHRVVELVDRLSPEQLQPPVGVLTGEHRDIWAQARGRLEKVPANADALSTIDRALIVLCLEDYSPPTSINESHLVMFHGVAGLNRWFDKAIQLIVTPNGRAGVNGEHSPADAVVPGRIFNGMVQNEPAVDPEGINELKLEEPALLSWTIDGATGEAISAAKIKVAKFVSTIHSTLLHYSGYGATLIKQLKVSPDAYVQMALQLAYYRQHGQVAPTYETASTRAFLHGRTEAVRSCSVESTDFVKKFDDPEVTKPEKLKAFQSAIAAHLAYMKKASRGQGVDRHLLGLRCMLKEGEAHPTLFTHPTYVESMAFRLSTSNMGPGTYLYGGFAPVVKDGYGVNYGISEEDIKLSFSKWAQNNSTDNLQFRSQVERALDDLATLLLP